MLNLNYFYGFLLYRLRFLERNSLYLCFNFLVCLLIQGGLQSTIYRFVFFDLIYAYFFFGFELVQNVFLVRLLFFKLLCGYFILIFFGINYGWSCGYHIIGYNFSYRSCYRRGLFRLNLGYSRHKLIINIPNFVYILRRTRRKFVLFCNSFFFIYPMLYYLHNLRNILPYKLRGLTLTGSRLYVLKQGKKIKFR